MSSARDRLQVIPSREEAQSPVAALAAPSETVGACGRKIVRYAEGEGRLALVVEPDAGKAAPCTLCRRDCPGKERQSEEK